MYQKQVNVVAELSHTKTSDGQTVTANVVPEKVKLIGNRSVLADIDNVRTESINVLNVKNKDKIKVKLNGIPENVKVEGGKTEVEVTFDVK